MTQTLTILLQLVLQIPELVQLRTQHLARLLHVHWKVLPVAVPPLWHEKLTITKALQDQYESLFKGTTILKGKSNYISTIDSEIDVETLATWIDNKCGAMVDELVTTTMTMTRLNNIDKY